MTKYKTLFLSNTVLLVLLIILFSVPARASTAGWIRDYGGADEDYAMALVEASDGGYVIAGYTRRSESGYDSWLIKMDSLGNLEWNKTYFDGMVCSLVEASDGGYAMCGYTYSFDAGRPNFWLLKTDANGNAQWNRTYGGAHLDFGKSLVQTSDGGYAMCGYTYSFGAGATDFWLVKTDSAGNMQWNRTYGGEGNDVAYSLVVTSDGGFALAGETDYDFWLVKTDANGDMEWNQTYGGEGMEWALSLVKTSDGGYALAGQTNSFGAEDSDCWLVKTDSAGNMQWNKPYGEADNDAVHSLIETSDGGFALAGDTYSFGAINKDFWLIKTDANGNMEWNQTHGGTRSEYAESVIETSDGGYVLAGETNSFGVGNNALVVKTNEYGKVPDFLVRIKVDGTVEGTDKIQRNGNVYTFTDNIFVSGIVVERDNIVVDGKGYTLSGSGNYGGENGFDLITVNNVTIKNTIIQNFTVGINLRDSFFATIIGNKIKNNGSGISTRYSYDIIISGNELTKNNWVGIHFFGGSHSLISGNNITDNRVDGVHMYGSYNTITGNRVSSNENGLVTFEDSMYNHIKGNTITNQTKGIHLTRSTYNSIFENNITDNRVGVVFFKESSNNTIYSNNFVNNDQQIFVDPKYAENLSVNVWDNGVEGNYWSNYNGTGNTPYIIDENNQDNYPLVKQYIIPEFPSWNILPLLLAATLGATICKRRLTKHHSY